MPKMYFKSKIEKVDLHQLVIKKTPRVYIKEPQSRDSI